MVMSCMRNDLAATYERQSAAEISGTKAQATVVESLCNIPSTSSWHMRIGHILISTVFLGGEKNAAGDG